MTFQAEETLLVSDQHLWIDGTMGFVATHASLQTHRGMLKSERASFVRMALHASRFVTKSDLELPGLQASMRLMAINTVDRSFIEPMPIGFEKGCLNFLVAIGAECVGLLRQQVERFLGVVNVVTLRAGNLILPM
jgi:hypothetical protein